LTSRTRAAGLAWRGRPGVRQKPCNELASSL